MWGILVDTLIALLGYVRSSTGPKSKATQLLQLAEPPIFPPLYSLFFCHTLPHVFLISIFSLLHLLLQTVIITCCVCRTGTYRASSPSLLPYSLSLLFPPLFLCLSTTSLPPPFSLPLHPFLLSSIPSLPLSFLSLLSSLSLPSFFFISQPSLTLNPP